METSRNAIHPVEQAQSSIELWTPATLSGSLPTLVWQSAFVQSFIAPLEQSRLLKGIKSSALGVSHQQSSRRPHKLRARGKTKVPG
jgi:hypothetical protein